MEGIDQLDFIQRSTGEISAFEDKDTAERPWAYGSVP